MYANYPFNPVTYNDRFLNGEATISAPLQSGQDYVKNEDGGGLSPYGPDRVKKDIFTFHSPETSFRRPYLTAKEIKVYGEMHGTATGNFEEAEDHPKNKLIGDFAFVVATVLGLGNALGKMDGGSKKITMEGDVLKSSYAGSGTAAGIGGVFGVIDLATQAAWTTNAGTYGIAFMNKARQYQNNSSSTADQFGAIFSPGIYALGVNAQSLFSAGVQPGDSPSEARQKLQFWRAKNTAATTYGVDYPTQK